MIREHLPIIRGAVLRRAHRARAERVVVCRFGKELLEEVFIEVSVEAGEQRFIARHALLLLHGLSVFV